MIRQVCLGITLFGLVLSASAQSSLADVAVKAVQQSKLTVASGTPFHLKAKIVESTNPDSPYHADIEEYWAAPDKWRRVIQSESFSQTKIVNGQQVFEENTGEYYPIWLNQLVTAIDDPLPMLEQLKQSNMKMMQPSGGGKSTSCARFQNTVGIPPIQNSVFFVFCFEGGQGLLSSVTTPDFAIEFKDYKEFKGKQVARKLVTDPEPGTTIEATVTELSELKAIDDSLFGIGSPTPPEKQLTTLHIDQATLQKLVVSDPEIKWPPVRDGKTSGVLSVYVGVDRTGQVRETWPLNSDNAQLNGAAREQVLQWKYKPATSKGAPVQLKAILTFAFQTDIGNPITVLSNEEARKLASHVVEAELPPGAARQGTKFTIRIYVGEDGKIRATGNPNNLPGPLFFAAMDAVRQWQFRPYLRNGKPDVFHAEITFVAP